MIGTDMRLLCESPPLPVPTVEETAAKLSITAHSKWDRLRLVTPETLPVFLCDGAGKLWYWGLHMSRPAEPTKADLKIYVNLRKREIHRRRIAERCAPKQCQRTH